MVVSDFEGMMKDVPSLIGSETDSARRVRKHREIKEISIPTLQCNDDVTNGNTEIEIELDKELELNNKETVEKLEDIPYKEIVDYLNEKAGRQFRLVDKTKTLIKARWNEGQRLDDFKKVVDIKIKHANDSNNLFNETYLQPSTLFGNKFDEYRNQFIASKPKNVSKQKNVGRTTDRGWSCLDGTTKKDS